MEQVMGVEPTSSAWKAEVIAVIPHLHIWCTEWDLNPYEITLTTPSK